MAKPEPLDALPANASEAAFLLRHIAGISRKAALLNTERKLLAIAKWVDRIVEADADVLIDMPPRAAEQQLTTARPVPIVQQAEPLGEPPVAHCEICRREFYRQSNRQRMCAECQASNSHRSVEEVTGTKEPDSVCERCGKDFARKIGHAGKFCSRDCYERKVVTVDDDAIIRALRRGPLAMGKLAEATGFQRETLRDHVARLIAKGVIVTIGERAGRRYHLGAKAGNAPAAAPTSTPVPTPVRASAPIVQSRASYAPERTTTPPAPEPPPLRAKEVKSTTVPSTVTFPERRCGRCMKVFKPTAERQYVCDGCTKPVKVERIEEPEVESVWSGRKDQPSISSYPTPEDEPESVVPAPSASSLDVVEERDGAVLKLIDAARGGRTLRELKISRTEDSEAAIAAALTRLRVKKRIQFDSDNGKWSSV